MSVEWAPGCRQCVVFYGGGALAVEILSISALTLRYVNINIYYSLLLIKTVVTPVVLLHVSGSKYPQKYFMQVNIKLMEDQ